MNESHANSICIKMILPTQVQAVKKLLDHVAIINYYYPCVKINVDGNNCSLEIQCADQHVFTLVKWLINNYWSLANNAFCQYDVSQLPPSMQALNDVPAISTYTNYDLHRAQKFTSNLPKHLLELSDAENDNPATAMGKFALAYNMYHQTDSIHGNQILMSTGTPGFKPFHQHKKSFGEAIVNQEDAVYAQYGLPAPDDELTQAATRFLKQQQLIADDKHLSSNEVVLGNGSTHLYNMLLSSIITSGDMVLMPRPCYGLFVGPVYDYQGEVGFIDLDKHGKISPLLLKSAIEYYQKKIIEKYILTHLLVRLEKITRYFNLKQITAGNDLTLLKLNDNFDDKNFRKYIDAVNDLIHKAKLPKELQLPPVPCIKAFFHMNPHNPAGSIYSQQEIDDYAQVLSSHPEITIIDDLAHYDVHFSSMKLGNFSNASACTNNVVTLLSMSKGYCQANMRAAFAYGPPQIIVPMQVKLMTSTFSMSYPAEKALLEVLNAPHDMRASYLTENKNEYLFRKNLIQLLVYGFDQCELPYARKLSLAQYLYSYVKEVYPLAPTEMLAKLLAGVPYLQLTYEPNGCFFYLVNVKEMIGLRIGDHLLNSSLDVRNALLFFEGIDSIPGELSGNLEKFTLRISYSIPRNEIVDAFSRVHNFINVLRTIDGKIPSLTQNYMDNVNTVKDDESLLKALTLTDQLSQSGAAKKIAALSIFKPLTFPTHVSQKLSPSIVAALSENDDLDVAVVRLENMKERVSFMMKK